MATRISSEDTFARLHAAHTALQLSHHSFESFHALATQHLLSALAPTITTTALLPPNTLATATASFVSAYGGRLWPSYAPYHTHLTTSTHPFDTGSRKNRKIRSASLLGFPRDAIPKTNDVQKAREKSGGGQAELVAKTKLGKLVGKYLGIVAEEVFAGITQPGLGEEVRGKLLQAVLGNLDWSALRDEIEGLEAGVEGALRSEVPVADTVLSLGAPSERLSGDISPAIDATSPGADAGFGVDIGLQDGVHEVVDLDLEELGRSEQKWVDWAQEVKRERKRADSVIRVEEWMVGLGGEGDGEDNGAAGGGDVGVFGSVHVSEGV